VMEVCAWSFEISQSSVASCRVIGSVTALPASTSTRKHYLSDTLKMSVYDGGEISL
jgi:hypothetical protein